MIIARWFNDLSDYVEAKEIVKAIEALHNKTTVGGKPICVECKAVYPCTTIQIIKGV